MVILVEGSPLFSEEHWSFERVTIGFLVTSLIKALLPRLLSLDSSRKSPGNSNILPFTIDGGHCAHWNFQTAEIYCILPRIWAVRQSCLVALQTTPLNSC
ncbi:hypothetical protein ILYODFUR_010425 [Ilyodon furcidens]|uniref:Uncharacterized protein n=1 Tax=Ilyodon furcidens TaxID=33524 RepID=A0ABV0SNG1_9TELE